MLSNRDIVSRSPGRLRSHLYYERVVERIETLTRRKVLGLGLGATIASAGVACSSPAPPPVLAWQRRLTTGTQADPTRIAFLGDSITFGGGGPGSGNSAPKYRWCYPGRLRELLRPVYGDAGTGWVLLNHTLWPVSPLNRGWDPRLTLVGAIRKIPAGPFKLSCARIPPSGGRPTAAVEFTATGSSVSTLVLGKPNGSSRQLVSVDGQDPVRARNVSEGGPAPDLESRAGTDPHHVWTDVPLGSAGSHSVRIWAEGDSCELVAVRMGTGSGLIDLDVLAVSGQSLNSFLGPGNDDTSTSRYGLSFVDTFATDLLVIALGTNDYNEGRSLAAVRTMLQTLIGRQRATGGDVALTFPPISSPSLYPGGGAPSYTDYERLYADVGTELDVPLLDLTHLWGSDFAASDALRPQKYADHAIHPSDDGAYDLAVAWRNFLGL
jgi:lysophospholipase L1-like esterase